MSNILQKEKMKNSLISGLDMTFQRSSEFLSYIVKSTYCISGHMCTDGPILTLLRQEADAQYLCVEMLFKW